MEKVNNLSRLADLLKARNTVESNMTHLIGHPVNIGSVGDYIASVIFGITHEESTTRKIIYDRFAYGPLTGHTVDVQWHIRREGDLSLKTDTPLDYYLVMAGPKAGVNTARSLVNPWIIEEVFLFDAKELLTALHERGVLIGPRTSVITELWDRAEIYPIQRNKRLILTEEQRNLLALFR
jgi:hypothetical protein